MKSLFGKGSLGGSKSSSSQQKKRSSNISQPFSSGNNSIQRSSQHQESTPHVERIRVAIPNAHVFKLPPRQSGAGWRGAEWTDQVWQGTLKVVERWRESGDEETAIVLVDKSSSNIFAVCPVTGRQGAVDRCIDSSRYFVLRIENAAGKHMFIGLAFNERNDAFDFNTALEDSRREKAADEIAASNFSGPSKDYSIKAGQKIHIELKPKIKTTLSDERDSPDKGSASAASRRAARSRSNDMSKRRQPVSGGLLAPSSKDTPSRGEPR
mmetsp:Transcript_19945/g.29692  ORF Transcript_19945/g.29692 Transcript_19945/m.29692 type:complete len:267 (-) Transcript_19945:789-1589(-)|eukprot:CAMPEP_0116015056 /NCGR_PEP_ID=MMETSP0321-20121206/6620_1 /TAXON_ID=163516 /ORGANISM="Leptocylindrus danicus var. danicus, Strain B650" /LENGTH=266 /DNA_ID=CAMNT_0003484775 /DNA_START=140 /DNA_END=940 /DNA_ORIENTATION=-